jgi:hypothetical protein
MTTKLAIAIAIALAAATLALGCNKDKDEDSAPEPETPAPTSKAAAAEQIMNAYDTCRVKLAADDEAIAACSADIEKAAVAGKVQLGDTASAIAAAASALAKMPADDIEKLRVGFGEVSRPVEMLLIAVPEVAAKYRMYECSMAKGFNRWAERSSGSDHQMANPYMGTTMQQCGAEVHDHHAGHGGKEPDLMATEMAAHQAAKTILDEHCAGCHLTDNAKSKKAKKALEHFVMDSYPYGGHHAADLGASIRKVLGVDGDKATMPKDDPGSITGAELDAIVAWTRAWDAAKAAGVGHHTAMEHGDHDEKGGDQHEGGHKH